MEALSLKNGDSYISVKSVHPLIYSLVANNMESYHNIIHNYTIDEVIDLCEILIVKQENEAKYLKSQRSVK